MGLNLVGLYAGSIGTGSSQTSGSAHVFEAVVNGSSSSVGVDGSLTAVNPGIQGLGGGVTLGANSTVTGEFFNGDIFEAVLTRVQCQRLNARLCARLSAQSRRITVS